MMEVLRKLNNVWMLGVNYLSGWPWFGLGTCELKDQGSGL